MRQGDDDEDDCADAKGRVTGTGGLVSGRSNLLIDEFMVEHD